MNRGGARNRGVGVVGPPGGLLRAWASKTAFLLALASPAAPAQATGGGAAATERVGPVLVSTRGRARVRSDRPDGEILHIAWAAPPVVPDWELRQSLTAFERATFPDGGAAPSLVATPPEPWMADLAHPKLPVRWNDRLVDYLRYFRDRDPGRALMRGWLRRAGRYEPRLRAILTEVGVPEDLVFVALAESGFNPRVRSRVGAAGLWQFMEATGNVYGLQQDFWTDDRFDVDKSSYAAAAYLADLHARFGSWELALAAYNAGYGLVMTAIDRHNTNSFWALAKIESGLPYATVNYVPKIIAAALVGRNREALGYGPDVLEAHPVIEWVEVKLPRSTRLTDLATLLDTDADILAEINGAFIRGRTPPGRSVTVRIPRDKAEAFAKARPQLEAKWRTEGTLTVQHGQSLGSIARRHGITEKALRKLNGIRDSAEVSGGVVLVVPSKVDPAGHAAADVELPPLAAVPQVQLSTQQRLVFLETTRATTPPALERAFGVRWSDIVQWNDLDPRARLQSGLMLQVVVAEDFDGPAHALAVYERDQVEHVVRGSRAHLEAELKRRGRRRRGYRVRPGDSLGKIGGRFGLTIGDLSRINQVARNHSLEAGDVLVVYVTPAKAKGTVRAPAPVGFAEREAQGSSTRAPSTPSTARVPGQGVQPRSAPTPSPSTPASRKPSTSDTARVPGR